MLTCASFNLIFGRIFQLYSTKWAFLVSIIIFEIGSAICGAAPNSTAFIVGRAIAGLGAAGIFSGGNNMVVVLVPLRKRPTFISIFGIAFGVTAVLGPIVGGAFTDNVYVGMLPLTNLLLNSWQNMEMVFLYQLADRWLYNTCNPLVRAY